MLEELKSRIAAIENQISQVMENHSFLKGALAALKEAVTLGEALAPANPVVEGLEAVANVAESVEADLSTTNAASSSETEQAAA